MITQFTFRHFKSFREATLPLSPLTVLIGPNASGKSNAIEGVRLLSTLASGRYVDEVRRSLYEDGLLRGSLAALTWMEQTDRPFVLGLELSMEEMDGELPRRFSLEIGFKVTPESIHIVCEEMRFLESPSRYPFVYRTVDPGEAPHTLLVEYNNFARGGRKPRIRADARQAIFAQLTTPARFTTPKAQERIPAYTTALREALGHILFLEPRPARMRDYSFLDERELRSDGSNLSAVLHNLFKRTPEAKQRVLDFVRTLPEREIREIGFIQTARREVMVRLEEDFGPAPRWWDADVLSDGTLRVLAIAAALFSAPRGTLVIIEEIDNGVHPSRARGLLENIWRVGRERGIHVLLTTHNPALLDALPSEAVPDVVYCYRDPVEGDSRLIRLAEMPDYPATLAQGSLGGLLRDRVLERYVQAPLSSDQKREQALAWLDEWFQSDKAGVGL